MKKIATRIFKFLRFLFLACFIGAVIGVIIDLARIGKPSMDGVAFGVAIGMIVTVLVFLSEKDKE